MRTFRLILADKFIWLLLGAITLASVAPVAGESERVARILFDIGIFTIFLFHGIRLQPLEVWAGMRNFRLQGAIFGWVFGAMLLAGWLASTLLSDNLPTQVALGFLFLGVLPSTIQSATSYCAIAKGNVAASVVASAFLNLVGVVLSPLLFAILASSAGIEIHGDAIIKIGMTLLLPFAIGQAIQRWARPLILHHAGITGWIDKGAVALAVYIAFGSAVVAGLWNAMPLSAFGWLLCGVAGMLVVGFGGGWLLGGVMSFVRNDRKTMLFSGGQKSVAIGTPLAAILFPPEQAGLLILPLVTYHLAQMLVSAPLAVRLAEEV